MARLSACIHQPRKQTWGGAGVARLVASYGTYTGRSLPFGVCHVRPLTCMLALPSLWNPFQKWLREAEVKRGRICMLAFVGFVAGDLLPLPGVTLSSVAAHDANLGEYGGAMGQIFWWIGLVEILGSIPAINYTMNGGDREPGDYAFDPLGFIASATPAQKEEMQLKELKNGRLAMMAFSGIVTQAALGHPNFPYV